MIKRTTIGTTNYYQTDKLQTMGEVNFYLKKPTGNGSLKRSLIILQLKYNGRRLVFSTKQTIHPDNWNSKKQQVKSNCDTTRDGKYLINDYLKALKDVCESAYNKEIVSGIPEPNTLKAYLNKFLDQNNKSGNKQSFYDLLNRFISGEVIYKGREKSSNTLKNYKTLLTHLTDFERVKKYSIDFNTIDLDFLYKYIKYLRSWRTIIGSDGKKKTYPPLSQNSIAKDIQFLKAVLKKAVTLNQSTNNWFAHDDFKISKEETDSVYLTEREIADLYNYDLSKNKSLEEIRDLFVFGAYTGLRFQSYSDVRSENIVVVEGDLYIKIVAQKTKELVIIPCNPIILQIFKKYEDRPNKLPRSVTNQHFNRAIKKICELAGLNEKGRLCTNPEKPLHECISSHTCRRSFVTNLYLEGFPVHDLMKITGHKTDSAFMTYLKVSKLDAARRLSTHIKRVWSERLLKVV